ncbi:MAG: DUF1134 domain-containing protein [Novosphingobium sp.]|nr:DUF1134 domain-containing protein [Novosphingobium sp.]
MSQTRPFVAGGWRRAALGLGAVAAIVIGAAPGAAQIKAVDPDKVIDADLAKAPAPPARTVPAPPSETPATATSAIAAGTETVPPPAGAIPGSAAATAPGAADATYHKDDLIGAAQGVFGKGAKGLAGMIEGILKKQGEPNAYIVGREGGGAIVVGLRYGSGTLFHKIEGQRPVYWTGPSIGFDAGASAGNTFVLVYNLYDSGDLYKRYGAGEGQAYLVGGFHVSYLRRGHVVLIPVRMGVGMRLGVNAGYMKFSHKQRWLPF